MLGFLPTNMTVNITTAGKLDKWGEPTQGSSVSVPAFVTSNSDSRSITVASGEEIVYSASILIFEKIVITESNGIEWTDALGQIHSGHPLAIDVNTDLEGNFTYTKVLI